jgi:hypothetical protein
MTLALLILYGALVVLNSLDGYSTWKVLRPSHYHREHNPVARRLFQKLGLKLGIVVAEILWIGFITLLFFLLWRNPMFNGALLVLLGLGVLAFSFVVVGNFRAWGRLRKREETLATRKSEGQNQC